jgi:hypothetical protein
MAADSASKNLREVLQRRRAARVREISESVFKIVSDHVKAHRGDYPVSAKVPSMSDIIRKVDDEYRDQPDTMPVVTKTVESIKRKLRKGESLIEG